MNLFKKIFKKNSENTMAVAPAKHIYKITGINYSGDTCQTTIIASNEAEARKKAMQSAYTEARGYIRDDKRDYSLSFKGIISVVRI